MINEPDQTQAGKTVRSKYECVVVELGETHIVAHPGDVMIFDRSISFFEFGPLSNVFSFGEDSKSKPILPKYSGYPYITIGGDFSDLKAFQESVREEIKGLEGKLGEGQNLSLDRIRQHFAQKPEYVVLGNYRPLLSQLM